LFEGFSNTFSRSVFRTARSLEQWILSESPNAPERRAQMPNLLSLSGRRTAVNAYSGEIANNLLPPVDLS
jgi:hypothetical protein